MSATPLLSILKKSTFITFASSAEDMNNVFVQSDSKRKFVFSKYALLELPDMRADGFDYQNVMNLNQIESHYINGLNVVTPINEKNKLDFSESFQNYVMNFESLLTSSPSYDRSLPRNCAERIFFKWMKESGALRFKEDKDKVANLISSSRFIEDILDDNYSKIVKYIGEVDMQGSNLASNENAFNEVYLNIPTQAGCTPTILFESISDKNYNEETAVVSRTNSEFINGREESMNPTSAGLTIEAIYDQDVQYGNLKYTTNGEEGLFWYGNKMSSGPNAYYTDVNFNDPTTDLITRSKSNGSDRIIYQRSRLDGISIDFNVSHYGDVEEYNRIHEDKIVSFNQYNAFESADNFDFNTILLYYDVYDPENPETDSTTNLFGVLFISDMVSTGINTSKFLPINKIKQDDFISQQGNGFGFKLNFKFDVSSNQVDKRIEVSVNDYNTFSMSLFLEAVNMMIAMNRDYEKMLKRNTELVSQIENYQILLEQSDVSLIINKLKQNLEENPINEQHESITKLLEQMSIKINEILSGKTSVKIENIISLDPKDEITANYKNSKLEIGNSRQHYSSSKIVNFSCNMTNVDYLENIIKLEKFTNLVIHRNNGSIKDAEANLVIRIDDTNVKWVNNQTMKIIISDQINFGNKGIIIYTDAEDNFKNGQPYKQLVGIVDELPSTSTIIEITCLNSTTYDFIVSNS